MFQDCFVLHMLRKVLSITRRICRHSTRRCKFGNVTAGCVFCLYHNLVTELWISHIAIGHACIVCSGIQYDLLLRESARTAIAYPCGSGVTGRCQVIRCCDW
jgi:hypothetical protein